MYSGVPEFQPWGKNMYIFAMVTSGGDFCFTMFCLSFLCYTNDFENHNFQLCT